MRSTRRAMLIDHLAMAERHVRDGARCVARQRERIRCAKRDGFYTAEQSVLLEAFQRTQAVFEADQARLRDAVAALI